MNKITMKKSVFVLILSVIMLFSTALGAVASNGVERIQAALNHNIKFLLNGSNWSPKDNTGKTLSALVYNGSTYVPLRAVSEALGSEVIWNAPTSTITINANDGIPYLDGNSSNSGSSSNNNSGNTSTGNNSSNNNSGNTSTGNNAGSSASTAKGTITDPVPLAKSYSYNDIYTASSSNDDEKYSSDYTITITKAVPIAASAIDASVLSDLKSGPDIEYKLVTIKTEMKNAKLINTKYTNGLYVNSTFSPNFWGSKTTGDKYIIGTAQYLFDGAYGRAATEAIGSKIIKKGETASYTVEGNIILPVIKNTTNYFVVKKNDRNIAYDDSFVYFKLN